MQRGKRLLAAGGILLTGTAMSALFKLPPRDPVDVASSAPAATVDPAQESTTPPNPLARRRASVTSPRLGPIERNPAEERPLAHSEIQRASPKASIARGEDVPFATWVGGAPPENQSKPPRTAPQRNETSEVEDPEDSEDLEGLEQERADDYEQELLGKHLVRDGDTLRSLARRYYGDEKQATLIYEANTDLLSDPMVLPINTRLKLPRKSRARSAAPLEPEQPDRSDFDHDSGEPSTPVTRPARVTRFNEHPRRDAQQAD